MDKQRGINDFFVDGPVEPTQITELIRHHSEDKRSGACQLFLGQVRDDEINGKKVAAIEYTTYRSMVKEKYQSLREEILEKHNIRHLHILHSLGTVKAGETSLLVMVTSEHRNEAIEACRETILLIKKQLPIWGKELFADDSYVWKENDV